MKSKILPLLIFAFFFSLFAISHSALAWWNTSWQYRIPITIQENSGNTLTDYQVKLTIDTATPISEGKMNSDCSDIRFTYYNETSGEETQIPYWVESGCNTNNTIIWVKVPYIPANNTATIYMYYGNPSATSESNPKNVFYYFQDFNGTSTSCVDYGFDATGCTISNGVMELTDTSTSGAVYALTNATFPNGGKEYRFFVKLKTTLDFYAGAGCFEYQNTDRQAFWLGLNPDKGKVDNVASIDIVENGNETFYAVSDITQDEYHLYELRVTTNNISLYADGLYLGSSGTSNTLTSPPSQIKFLTGVTKTGTEYIDTVFLASYIIPEPTYTLGSEEIVVTNQPPTITISSPQNQTYYTTNILANFTVTDDNSTTFWVKAYLDNQLIYNNTAYANNTEIDLNLTPYITQDKSYNFTVWANDTDTSNPAVSEQTVYYTVKTYPYFTNITVSPASPQTYGISQIWFNVSLYDELKNQKEVILETNLTGNLENYTMLNDTPNHFFYNWTIKPPAGRYIIKFYAYDSAGNVNVTEYNYTIEKAVSHLNLFSSAGWNLYAGTTTIISATSTVETPHIKINDISVSNPYTFLPEVGFYDVYTYIDDYQNYTDWNVSKTLVVMNLPTCTDNNTFAFEKDIETNSEWTVLNFSQLIEFGYVKNDLSDVWVNASYVRKNNSLLIVNTTGISKLIVRFGNELTDIKYQNSPLPSSYQLINIENYRQINPYAYVKLLDEETAKPLYPPGSEVFAIVGCDLGKSIFKIRENITHFIVTSRDPIDEISVRVKYSPDAYYRRTKFFNNITSAYVNMYVADVYKTAMDRIDLVMADPDHYNSLCQIYIKSAGRDIIITEGYFDTSHKLSVYLEEDRTYNIRVIDPNGNVVEYGTLVVVEPETKEIGSAQIKLTPQTTLIANNITVNAYRKDNQTIHVDFIDTSKSTEILKINVYNGTHSLVYNTTYYNTSELHSDLPFTAEENQTYEVDFVISSSLLGNFTQSIFVGNYAPVYLPIQQSYKDFISLVILLLIAGLIAYQWLLPGVVMFDVGLIFFKIIGWISLSVTSIFFIIVLTIIGVAVYIKEVGA